MLRRGLDAERRSSRDRTRDLLVVVKRAPEIYAEDLQAQALDGLEVLARAAPNGRGCEEFLSLLEDDRNAAYDPAWDGTEAMTLAAYLRDARGEGPLAAARLRELAFSLLREGGSNVEAEVEDLIHRIETLSPGEDTAALRARLPPPAAVPLKSSSRPVRIGIFGGDERLEAARAKIEGRLNDLDPGIKVEVHATDWSSNWGRQMDRIRPGLRNLDAIVVLRLIRTHLGRALRREHACWVGCSDHSPESVVHASRIAAARARATAAAAGAGR